MTTPKECVWVVGKFGGDQAKTVLAHAHAGIGYTIIETNGNKMNPSVIAAFRTVIDSRDGLPDHLIEVVDQRKIAKYEENRTRNHQQLHKPASAKTVEKVRMTLPF